MRLRFLNYLAQTGEALRPASPLRPRLLVNLKYYGSNVVVVDDTADDETGESSVNWKLEEVYRRGTEAVQPDASAVQQVDASVQQAGTTLKGNSPQVTGEKGKKAP